MPRKFDFLNGLMKVSAFNELRSNFLWMSWSLLSRILMDYECEILLSLPTRAGGYCIVFTLLVNDQFLFGNCGEPRGVWQKEFEKQRLTATEIGNVNINQHIFIHNSHWLEWFSNDSIERFSNDCRKTKTKAITPTNHNGKKQLHEPITIPSNYL